MPLPSGTLLPSPTLLPGSSVTTGVAGTVPNLEASGGIG